MSDLLYLKGPTTVIVLQINMVSPGTHLVKIMSPGPYNQYAQFKETRRPKLKMKGLYVTRQLIWRQMPKHFILQLTEIKI